MSEANPTEKHSPSDDVALQKAHTTFTHSLTHSLSKTKEKRKLPFYKLSNNRKISFDQNSFIMIEFGAVLFEP